MPDTRSRFGYAWIYMTMAFTLHVIDEAVFGFLPLYNSVVSSAKEKFSFIPIPTFTFRGWLTMLIMALVILYSLSIFAFQRKRWLTVIAIIYGTIMLLNGIMHPMASLYFGKVVGGIYSSIFLILASAYLLNQAATEIKFRNKSP